jgi:predicted small lipoprotein YifL
LKASEKYMTKRFYCSILLSLFGLLLVLNSCGFKGPLYLPGKKPPSGGSSSPLAFRFKSSAPLKESMALAKESATALKSKVSNESSLLNQESSIVK